MYILNIYSVWIVDNDKIKILLKESLLEAIENFTNKVKYYSLVWWRYDERDEQYLKFIEYAVSK